MLLILILMSMLIILMLRIMLLIYRFIIEHRTDYLGIDSTGKITFFYYQNIHISDTLNVKHFHHFLELNTPFFVRF